MRPRRALCGGVIAAAALAGCGRGESARSAQPLPPPASVADAAHSSSVAWAVSVPETIMVGDPGSPPVIVDHDYLSGVSPVSVPMAISVHLAQVTVAVRSIVGNGVFAGAIVEDESTDDVRITIYGTDVAAIGAALDEIGSDQRSRIRVVGSEFSFAELRELEAQAQTALERAGLVPAWVNGRYDGAGLELTLDTSADRSDEELLAAASEALAGLPIVALDVQPTLVPL